MPILSLTSPAPPSEPPLKVKPVRDEGFVAQAVAMLRYLSRTDVHTYAFSVAANTILSLFPFIVLLLTLTDNVFHSPRMELVIGDMLRSLLPTGQEFVVRNMMWLVHSHKTVAAFSVFMLLVSSTGVFLPLEIALNQVWGVKENRSYWRNQMVSLGLACAVGILALASVAFSAAHQTLLTLLFFGHTQNMAFRILAQSVLKVLAGVASIGIFFLIYWLLPNRKIPARAVLPSAIVTGLVWEGAKLAYIKALPWLDLKSVYGPFAISVGLMMWAFLSGLILLAGAHLTATRSLRRMARESASKEKTASEESHLI
ncbi:MAG TPA: YihY/virulence factor BrkB family protein [Acidobacteriaceae bacterium]|jgi:YihY family inner membrane protein|nr:YihY/virulence factor BrkB family protein [Acidobacteriaceae bacterium]